jgi:hypothetical protein
MGKTDLETLFNHQKSVKPGINDLKWITVLNKKISKISGT